MFVSVELVLQTTRLFLVRVRRASPDYRVKQTADAVFPRRRTAPLLPASSTRSCPSCPSSRRSSASLCRPECATSTSSRPASTTSPSSSSASAPSSSSGGTRPARPHRSRSWPTRQAAWSTRSLASCDVCSQRDPVMPSCRRACAEPALRALPGCRCARGVILPVSMVSSWEAVLAAQSVARCLFWSREVPLLVREGEQAQRAAVGWSFRAVALDQADLSSSRERRVTPLCEANPG